MVPYGILRSRITLYGMVWHCVRSVKSCIASSGLVGPSLFAWSTYVCLYLTYTTSVQFLCLLQTKALTYLFDFVWLHQMDILQSFARLSENFLSKFFSLLIFTSLDESRYRKPVMIQGWANYGKKPSITVQHIYLILSFNSLYLYIKFIVQKIIKIFIKILKTCNKYIQFILYQNKMHANIQNIHFIIQKSFTHAKNVYN